MITDTAAFVKVNGCHEKRYDKKFTALSNAAKRTKYCISKAIYAPAIVGALYTINSNTQKE